MITGHYHSIDTFGTVDGQGIRYVLFLAGCQLGCKFCHNPDTWLSSGKMVTVHEIIDDLHRYRPYYEASGGGITVTGGEPLLQSAFVAALFQECQKYGFHTTLDTSGYASTDSLIQVLDHTDAVLFSLKAACSDKHRLLTNSDNNLIIKNLRTIAAGTISLTLRYVVVPKVNNTRDDILKLANIVHSLERPIPVELLPYHTMGKQKWDKLGLVYPLDGVPDASDDDIAQVRKLLTENHVQVLFFKNAPVR